jgi:hypothetical protein
MVHEFLKNPDLDHPTECSSGPGGNVAFGILCHVPALGVSSAGPLSIGVEPPSSRWTILTLGVTICATIKSFKCANTEALIRGQNIKHFGKIARVARRKLRRLAIAGQLEDLKVPPGNRFEALKGDRSG